jgi:hypothetical protein
MNTRDDAVGEAALLKHTSFPFLPPVARVASWVGRARGSCKPSSRRPRACRTWAAAGPAVTTAASWDLGGGGARGQQWRADLVGGAWTQAHVGSGSARTWAAAVARRPGWRRSADLGGGGTWT